LLKTRLLDIELNNKVIPLAVAAEPEQLIGDLSDPDQTPCWAVVWPAARALACYIWGEPGLQGSSVLELGAGVGLPGVVCGLKGAAVAFSDFQPLALELCEQNARLNRLTDYRLLLEDWRMYSNRERFDLVLASDIAYEPRLLPHLKAVLLQSVKRGGALYITHDQRPVTFSFIEEILASGLFTEERLAVPVTVEDPLRPHYQIELHILKYTE
jgi:methyltransferase-like protein 23